MRSAVKVVQVGRDGQQRGRHREQREAERHAAPAVDAAAGECHHQRRDRHADRAGVDGEAHRRRRDLVVRRERRQDRLRREQIDQRQERDQTDDDRAPERGAALSCFVELARQAWTAARFIIDPRCGLLELTSSCSCVLSSARNRSNE